MENINLGIDTPDYIYLGNIEGKRVYLGSSLVWDKVNVCIFTIGSSGDKRGYIKGSIGDISPDATYSGVEIYEYTWNVVTGEFILSFGVAGNDYVTNIPELLITHHTVPDGNSAVWDDTQTAYIFTDLTLAQYIGTNTDESCFWVEPVPENLFLYDFSTIDTGVKE